MDSTQLLCQFLELMLIKDPDELTKEIALKHLRHLYITVEKGSIPNVEAAFLNMRRILE